MRSTSLLVVVVVVAAAVVVTTTRAQTSTSDVFVDPSSSCTGASCGTSASPFVSVREAQTHAPGGSTLVLRAATYRGADNCALEFTGAGQLSNVRGDTGSAADVVVDCEDTHAGWTLRSGTFTLRALTLRRGVRSTRDTAEPSERNVDGGGALRIISSYTVLHDVRVLDSRADGDADGGGGVFVWSNTVELRGDTRVENNTAADGRRGGGIYVRSANLQLHDNALVVHNAAVDGDDAGVNFFCADASIQEHGNAYVAESWQCERCSFTSPGNATRGSGNTELCAACSAPSCSATTTGASAWHTAAAAATAALAAALV